MDKHPRFIIVIATLVLFSITAMGTSYGNGTPADACVPHPPIHITENIGPEGFVLSDNPVVYRPGSGVSGGSGTALDPYVIENWCITPEGQIHEAGIHIENTSAHVIIRNNVVSGVEDHNLNLDEWTQWADVGGDGIVLDGVSNGIIESNIVHDHLQHGIHLMDATGNAVVGNTVYNNEKDEDRHWGAVHLESSHDNVIQDNDIRDSRLVGVALESSDRNVISGNTVLRSGEVGIYLIESHRNEIQENSVEDTLGWSSAVSLFLSDENVIEDNDIGNSARNGVRVGASDENAIRGNNIDASGLIGLLSNTARGNVVENNTLHHGKYGIWTNTADGFVLKDNTIHDNEFGASIGLRASDNVVEGNNIHANDRYGLRVRGDSHVIQDNTIKDNAELDGLVFQATDSVVKSNTIRGNGVVDWTSDFSFGGVYIDSDRVAFEGNTIVANGDHGIRILGSNVLVQDNLIRDNGAYGVHVDGQYFQGSTNAINVNTIRDNGVHGVWIQESNDNVVQGNSVENNGADGIYIDVSSRGSDRNEILDNAITGNQNGIHLFESEDTEIHGNNIHGNSLFGVLNEWAPVDATNNWWGCPDGPEAVACDGVSGDVIYEPWLTEPNPDTGVE